MGKQTASFSTTQLTLPEDVTYEVLEKIGQQSVIASLVTQTPQSFVDAEHIIFAQKPHAELVGEGKAKNGSDWGYTPVKPQRYKVQTTVRFNEEVDWANADNNLGALNLLMGAVTDSISEAIDTVYLHDVNPLTGEVATEIQGTGLIAKATKVEYEGDTPTVADFDAFPDKVIEAGYAPNGIAFAMKTANELRKMRNEYTGARIYPDVRMDLTMGNFEGLRSVTSQYVSGEGIVTAPTGVEAIIGDWGLLNWGFIRNIGLQKIEYGDPDGLGDLKRYNQIAYRAEAMFAVINYDPKGFAYLAKKA